MKKYYPAILISVVMIIAILGITNPSRDQNKMFAYNGSRLVHNYFIFSIYQQTTGYKIIEDGKYRLYKRYIGIATNFYEIEPVKVKQE